jgi:hypothetical protein
MRVPGLPILTLLSLLVLCLALPHPAAADLEGRAALQLGPAPDISPPDSLLQFDRALAPLNTSALVTVYISVEGGWMNTTEQNSMIASIQAKYGTVSTLINFTTVQPTSGSYHSINVLTGRDPNTADGLVWGEAWSTSANIYGGEFTRDSAVSSHFTSTTGRINGVGETVAHELDHILRGRGHVRNPGDINCDGTLVPASSVAADNRSFNSTDLRQKHKNIVAGATYKSYDAKPDKCEKNVVCVFGGEPITWDPDRKPFNTWVTLQVEMMADPEQFTVGFATEEGAWTFGEYAEWLPEFPIPHLSTNVPPGTRLDLVLIDNYGGFQYPVSDYGDIFTDPGRIIDPMFSMVPVVNEPYFGRADVIWHTPQYGDIMASLSTRNAILPPGECFEGFQVKDCSQTGVGDRGDLSPTLPRLLQNYPNPFGRSTTIAFTVPRAAGADGLTPVRLDVFDLQGRLVKTLVDRAMTEGLHTVTVDRAALGETPSGVFFYRLDAAGRQVTRKLLLLD